MVWNYRAEHPPAALTPREPAIFGVRDPLDAAGRRTQVPVDEREAGQAARTPAAHAERAHAHPGEGVVGDVGALAVARIAAQRPVAAADRPVVHADEVVEVHGLVAVHACVGAVDRVPAEALLDAADRREALGGVALERAVDVIRGDPDAPHAAVRGRLV